MPLIDSPIFESFHEVRRASSRLPHVRERIRQERREYKSSELGKANDHRYANSAKGRIVKQVAQKAYVRTEKGKLNSIRYEQKIRYLCLSNYSEESIPKCSCCGEGELAFLCLDHIAGGGNKHHKQLAEFGTRLFPWLYKTGYPKGYRVLCYNCNMAFGVYGYCPHVENQCLPHLPTASYNQRIKKECFEHYGGLPTICNCCQTSYLEFLSLDHISGGGNAHRQQLGNNQAVYRWLKKTKWPIGYQILCFNCNHSKGVGNFCIHQKQGDVSDCKIAA